MPEGAPQFVVENPQKIPARMPGRRLRPAEVEDYSNKRVIKTREQIEEDSAKILRLRKQIRQNADDDETVIDEAQFDKTVYASERVKKQMPEGYREADENAPYGYYFNRRILGRDMRINDSVYIGEGDREAIVIDDKKDASLRNAYAEFIETRRQEAVNQVNSRKNILIKAFDAILNRQNNIRLAKEEFADGIINSVFNYVKRALPYDKEIIAKLEELSKQEGRSRSRKICLGEYLDESAGVCRHQALLAAYILEKLINDGYLKGQVSVDRNKILKRGGHAWARFTDENGEITMIDAAQNFCGKMEEAGELRWKYARPEDIAEGRVEKVDK